MSKTMQQPGFDSLCSDHNKSDSKQLDLGGSAGSLTTRTAAPKLPNDGKPASRSAELAAAAKSPRPGHRRSVSAGAPLIFSGSSNAASSSPTLLPSGNICPSGKILRPGLPTRGPPNRTDVLGSGTGNYGRGSIVRGGNPVSAGAPTLTVKRAMSSGSDPEEVKRVGNELYRSGSFAEALALYDRAVAMSPGNAAYRSNRAAALTALGRLGEAARDCDEAVKLDPAYARAHKRLASLYLRYPNIALFLAFVYFDNE